MPHCIGQQPLTALLAAIKGIKIKDSDYKERNIKISFNPLTREFAVRSQVSIPISCPLPQTRDFVFHLRPSGQDDSSLGEPGVIRFSAISMFQGTYQPLPLNEIEL